MIKQRCVRTYEVNYPRYNNNPNDILNCESLNSFLKEGWKVVMVTPKSNYNEYIIEKEITSKENES